MVLTSEVSLVAVLHRSAWARRSSCKVYTALYQGYPYIIEKGKNEGITTSVEDMHDLLVR
jgi:hypothetical protein